MGARLQLGMERHDGTTVVTAAGEIDFHTASELRECLVMVTTPMVVVDLRAVSFLDSAGVGVLVAAQSRLCLGGGNLTLRKPQGMVRTVLLTLGLIGFIED